MKASFEQRAKASQSENIKVNLAEETKKEQNRHMKEAIVQNKKASQSTKLRLDNLQIGESGKIIAIHTKNEHLYRKLMNLGFFPGSEVQVLQRSPAYLLQVGFTQIALDQKTCALISVLITPTGF